MPLKIVQFKKRPSYYLRGTVTAGRKSRRIFESIGIRHGEAGSKARAEEVRIQREAEIVQELLYGAAIEKSWMDLALAYGQQRQDKRVADDPSLKDRPDPEMGYVIRLTDFFRKIKVAGLPLREFKAEYIQAFFTQELAGNELSYKYRFRDTYKTLMNLARKREWCGQNYPLPVLPKYDIAKVPVMKAIEDEDIELFVRLAPKHAKAYVRTVFATGLRGGEVLFVKRTSPDHRDRLGTGLCLEKGKEHIYLGKTKDGNPVLRWLSDELADALRVYLKGRTDKHDALFLTHRGVPYKRPWRQRGALCKTMWKSLTKRVADELRLRATEAMKAGDDEAAEALNSRAERCLRVSGHWGRHTMVTKGVKLGYSDLKIMQLTGHKSSRLLRRYTHIDEKAGKKLANEAAGSLDNVVNSPNRADTTKKPRRRHQF